METDKQAGEKVTSPIIATPPPPPGSTSTPKTKVTRKRRAVPEGKTVHSRRRAMSISGNPTNMKTSNTINTLTPSRLESVPPVSLSPGAGTGAGTGATGVDPQLKHYMDSHFASINLQLGGINGNVSALTETAKALNDRILNNTGEISRVSKELSELRSKVNSGGTSGPSQHEIQTVVKSMVGAEMGKIEQELGKLKAVNSARNLNPAAESLSRRENDSSDVNNFWRARRSIRIWPVTGDNQDELSNNVGVFFFEKMLIPREDLTSDCIEQVRKISMSRLRRGRTSQIQNEVLVTFKDVRTRDCAWSYAYNLGRLRIEGSQGVGIRIEVPYHLLGVFKTLEQYGFNQKKEKGQGYRRHIRFDDCEQDLYLDQCDPGETEWTRVRHHEALEANRASARQFNRPRIQSSPDTQLVGGTTAGLRESETLRRYSTDSAPTWGSRRN